MKLDVTLTEYFEQSIDDVWRAITDRKTLALWLMENDFEPRVGARFTLRREDQNVPDDLRIAAPLTRRVTRAHRTRAHLP